MCVGSVTRLSKVARPQLCALTPALAAKAPRVPQLQLKSSQVTGSGVRNGAAPGSDTLAVQGVPLPAVPCTDHKIINFPLSCPSTIGRIISKASWASPPTPKTPGRPAVAPPARVVKRAQLVLTVERTIGTLISAPSVWVRSVV